MEYVNLVLQILGNLHQEAKKMARATSHFEASQAALVVSAKLDIVLPVFQFAHAVGTQRILLSTNELAGMCVTELSAALERWPGDPFFCALRDVIQNQHNDVGQALAAVSEPKLQSA